LVGVRARSPRRASPPDCGISGLILGLLSLLLGFTFSIAVERYSARRDLVVKPNLVSVWTSRLANGDSHRQADERFLTC
jgi:hypothetical protein